MKNGYYSVYNKKKNLKIMAINTQVCDAINFFLLENPNDPLGLVNFI